jgi:hypothetical protein
LDIANQISDIADQIFPPSQPPGTPDPSTVIRILKGVKDFVTALDDLANAISSLTSDPIFKLAGFVLSTASAVLNFIISQISPPSVAALAVAPATPATSRQPMLLAVQAYRPASLQQAEVDLRAYVSQIPR